MTTLSQRVAGAVLLSGCVGLCACSQPFTDIVATNSDATGPWDVANAKVTANTLTADVCMDRASAADEVSDRLLFQLRNKGYQKIELTMFGKDGGSVQQRQVTWSPDAGKQMQQPSQTSDSRCANRPEWSGETDEAPR